MLLVHREREHIGIALEDHRRPVAVVDIEIDDGRAGDLATFLQQANRLGVFERLCLFDA